MSGARPPISIVRTCVECTRVRDDCRREAVGGREAVSENPVDNDRRSVTLRRRSAESWTAGARKTTAEDETTGPMLHETTCTERDLGPEEREREGDVSAAQTRSDSDNTTSLRRTAVAIRRKRPKLLSCPTSRHSPPKNSEEFSTRPKRSDTKETISIPTRPRTSTHETFVHVRCRYCVPRVPTADGRVTVTAMG
ncbi:hypothetical protein QTP88_007673 [Uroleucon formosanum]